MSLRKFFSGTGKGMKTFGEHIALLVNTALLFVVYIIGVGITSIIAKFANKSFMNMKVDRKAETYWEDLNLTTKETDEYYKQY